MAQQILITYKNGTSVGIDVSDAYYKNKYPKKSDKKLNKLVMKSYNKFVNAVGNTEKLTLSVNKYLPFSNAIISCKDILSIDLRDKDTATKNTTDIAVQVPGVHDQVFLNLQETSLEVLIAKLNSLALIENVDKLVQKLLAYFNKSNVEFTIKAATKKKASTNNNSSKKKVEPLTEILVDSSEIEIDKVSTTSELNLDQAES